MDSALSIHRIYLKNWNHVYVPIQAIHSTGVKDNMHKIWGKWTVWWPTLVSGSQMCIGAWILFYCIQRKFFKCWFPVSMQLPLSVSGAGRAMPGSLIVWSCQWSTFAFRRWCAVYLSTYSMAAVLAVSSPTKHQVHIAIFIWFILLPDGLIHVWSFSW